jgi:hypothetical protein
MSDDNYRDRRPPRQPGGKPVDPKRTILGMPGAPRPGLSGRTPGEPEEAEPTPSGRTATARGVAPIQDNDDEVPDKRYMEPPSETMGHLPSQLAPTPFGPARTRTPEADPRRVPAAQAGYDGRDERDRASPFGPTEMQPVRMPSAEPPPAPLPQESRPSPYSATAPEAWRAAARNVADKAKTVGAAASPMPPAGRNPGSSAVAAGRGKGELHTPSLRLKLDSEVEGYEEHYKGVPKSRLPGVLLGLLILIAAAGGGVYWADEHGGLASWAARLHLTEPGTRPPASGGADPTALGTRNEAVPAVPKATAPAPNAAAAPGSLTTPQPSAANEGKPAAPSQAPSATAPQAAAPAPAAAGKTPAVAQDSNAQALAEPDMKLEAPPAAAKTEKPSAAPPADKPVVQPKAAERRRPAPPPARPIVHHDPVLKIREIGAASAPGAPPEPADSPYVPAVPIDPPAPDEPR